MAKARQPFQDITIAEVPGSQTRIELPLAPRLAPSQLVLHARQGSNFLPAAPYPIQWLRTSKNLDFCLLAICSCVLTVLCHQTLVSPSTSALGSSSLSSAAPSSQLDSTVKSALFTATQQRKRQEKSNAVTNS